jgi:DNA polymerase-3 subunit alpha
MADFFHAHVHSDNSILDSSISAEELASEAARLGMKSMALTDHGNIFGHVEFYQACKKVGIKPVLGCEVYVARHSATEPMSKFGDTPNPTDHLVLLAETQEGYHNLIQLVTYANLKGYHYAPRIDLDALARHSKGLIGLTACLSGGVNRLIAGWDGRNPKTKQIERIEPDFQCAMDLALKMDGILGRGNFFLEVQNHIGPHQDEDLVYRQGAVIQGALELHKLTGIPLVGTNDIHFKSPEDARAREIAVTISRRKYQNKSLAERPDKVNHAGEFYVKSPEQMAAALAFAEEAVRNTMAIAERCNVVLDLGKRRFASPIVNGQRLTDEQVHELWERLLVEAMEHKFPNADEIYVNRLNYEKSVIEKMGFIPYFVIIWDFLRFARSRGIRVGPSRGSGGGCLIAFLLGITRIDPVKYDLIFERFLNPERVSMPDLDIDFDKDRVADVAEYLKATYGEDRIARIATFGNFWAKSTIREVGKQFELPMEEIEDLANAIPNSQGEFRVYLEDAMKDIAKIRDLANSPDETRRELFKVCSGLEGIKRQVSTHACGVVIADAPITNYLALMTQKDGEADDLLQVQADMHAVEALGLLKMDLLALKTLAVIAGAEAMVGKRRGKAYDVEEEGLERPEFYDLICSGRTMGLFQIESAGMREIVMRIQPKNLRELSDTIALFRPGPMDAEDEHGLTMVDHYILRKHGREKVSYPHPLLEPILAKTYGVIVYQEQIIKAVVALCGYTAAQADLLRRVIGKKKKKDIEEEGNKFVRESQRHAKLSEANAREIWHQIETFARYGFNEAHSLGYAVLTIWTTALKIYYPAEFMCALLSKASGEGRNEEDLANYIDECWRLGIDVYEPDVNKSQAFFTIEEHGIRAGFGMIKGVVKSAGQLVAARSLLGSNFKDFHDMLEKCVEMKVGRQALVPLIKSGACDSMGERKELLTRLVPQLNYIRKKRRAKNPDNVEEPEEKDDIEPMDDEEARAEILSALNCYSTPRYPMTKLGIVCRAPLAEQAAKLLTQFPGDVSTIIRIQGDVAEVSMDGVSTSGSEELIRLLRDFCEVYPG